ncbi:MAG: hypothetical protein IJO73_04795 [Clostridia bacterium]|nr:hypothetical protein [Clostridia bacterium]
MVSKTSSTSYSSWAIPEAAYNYISSGKVTVTIKCITYSGSTKIGEATTTLTATAKAASTVSATSAYIGQASTISISRNSSSFKHTVQYLINNAVIANIKTKDSATSISWTIPTSVYNSVSSTGKTVPIVIRCITYYGDVNLGYNDKTITATCLESACKPTLAPTIVDKGSTSIKLSGDANNIVIKGFNSMSYTIGATAKNGATIKSQKITCGSKSNTAASGSLSYVDSNVFTITATDSRGYSNSTTVTKKTLINYVRLTCALTADAKLATDSNGNSTTTLTIKASGNWFNGSFGAVTNTLATEYRYKINSGSYTAWTAFTPTKSGNTYSATKTITGLDYQSSYTVQVRAYDALYPDDASYGLVTPAAKTVSAKPVFDWGKSDFNFNVPVNMAQNTYYSTTSLSGGGLDMNNSDITNANSIYFSDMSSATGEGLGFPTNDNKETWDYLKAYSGELWFIP